MPPVPSIDANGATDPGRVRPVNEDHFLIGQLDKSLLVVATSLPADEQRRLIGAPEGQVLCVADGLGGHAAGEQASSTAVDATAHYLLHTMPCFFRCRTLSEDALCEELKAAVQLAQDAVRSRAAAHVAMRGMGTTLTLAFLQWPHVHLVHVGDSRCYLLRDELRQVTRDHTVLQQWIDEGRLRPGEKTDSKLAHALWNAIGGSEGEVSVDITKHDLQPGDTLLLCTDGLVRHVDDVRIRGILRASENAATAVRRLIEAANDGGGSDNITVVVARMPPAMGPSGSLELRLAQDPPDARGLLDGQGDD